MTGKEHNLLINVDELTWGFDDSPTLLFDKFNFSLYKGDFTVLMWKSGVWKSTFSRFLTWKIKAPIKTIYYKMSDLWAFSDDELQLYRRKIWLIFQKSQLIKSMTVKENIIYPLKIYGLWEATIEAKYNRIKKNIGFGDLEDRDISRLSWWEKQKVNLARALIHDPEFIVADEPTGNLDWENTQNVADLLIKANLEWKSILIFTHDIHLLNYLKKKIKINLLKL